MLKRGDISIDGELVLAPMAGYTDSPFRRIARRFGAGLVCSELVSADGIIRGNRKTMDLLKFNPEERPISIQIFGKDPDVMSEAAKIVEERGPDLIDINLGCCARRVVRGGAGAALLENPRLLRDITTSIVRSVGIPVSAKIRIGISEENKNYLEITKILEESGVSLITVHGRTRAQRFCGEADWDIIREIKEKVTVPVIGNGDIMSYSEALMRIKTSDCNAVMIGRGAIGNPWIFSGYIPKNEEIVAQIKEHLLLMLDFYAEKGIIIIRKHIVKYIRHMKNSAAIRARIINSESKDEIFDFLDSLIE